jgi:hypothetical protein
VPGSEAWWARSGCAAAAAEPIDRLVATAGCHAELAGTHAALRPLADIDTDAFWEGIRAEWSPPASIPAQVKTLRKLSVHGEFVWLAVPYVNEMPFACALVESVFRRPHRFQPPAEVELHTQPSRDDTMPDHLAGVRRDVRRVLKPGQRIRHVVHQRLLDRIVLAGAFTTTTTTAREHAPRWGVHMGHIARPYDNAGERHEWKLLSEDGVSRWFNSLRDRTPANYLDEEAITG